MAGLRDRSANQSKPVENSEQGPVVTTTRAASLELLQRRCTVLRRGSVSSLLFSLWALITITKSML